MSRTRRKQIIYPVFESILPYITNSKWNDCLKNCAKGILPKGVTFSNNVIYCKANDTVQHYEISPDIISASSEICSFLSHYTNMNVTKRTRTKSRIEKSNEKETVISRTKKILRKINATIKKTRRITKKKTGAWGSIKNKNRKLALLGRFTDMVTTEYSLTPEQIKELRYSITMADLENVLDECVKMQDGYITVITCIYFDGINFVYNRPHPRIKRSIVIPPPPNPIYRNYPNKQIDPIALLDTHFKALKKGKPIETKNIKN